MKTAVHQYEDKLLEFAYGELPSSEAAAVDAHVKGCTRCSEALTQIRTVRTAMSQLPAAPAPDAGLESLLAYAEQTAKRNAQGVKQAVWWRRYLMPLASAAALLVVGVVAWRASQDFNPDPGLMAIEMQKERDAKAVAPAQPVAAAATPAPEPAVAAGKEGAKAENKADKREEEVALDEGGAEQAEPRRKAAQPVADGRLNEQKQAEQRQGGGGRAGAGEDENQDDFADAFGTSAPLSQSKRDAKPKPVSKAPAKPSKPSKLAKVDAPAEEPLVQNYSNAGAYKAAPPKAEPPPMKDAVATKERADAPATPPTQTELSKNQRAPGTQAVWGLGTGGTSTGSGTGGVLGGASSAGPVATATPDTAKQEAAEGKSGAVQSKKKSKSVDDQPVVAQAAPPPPPAAVPQAPAPSSAPQGKGSLGLKGLSSSSSTRSSYGDEDQAMAEATDKLAVDREAQVEQRNQAQVRQKTLEAARAASNRSDRMTEVKLSLEVLATGAKGMERVEALKRVCDAYESMGEFDRAQPYCDTLVREFPNTAAAQAVAQRRSRQEKAPAAKRAAQPADALEAAQPDKEPATAPTSKPAEAY